MKIQRDWFIILQIFLAVFSFGFTIQGFRFILFLDSHLLTNIYNEGFRYPREFLFLFLTLPSHLLILLLLFIKNKKLKQAIIVVAPLIIIVGVMLNWWQPMAILLMYVPFIIVWILCLIYLLKRRYDNEYFNCK